MLWCKRFQQAGVLRVLVNIYVAVHTNIENWMICDNDMGLWKKSRTTDLELFRSRFERSMSGFELRLLDFLIKIQIKPVLWSTSKYHNYREKKIDRFYFRDRVVFWLWRLVFWWWRLVFRWCRRRTQRYRYLIKMVLQYVLHYVIHVRRHSQKQWMSNTTMVDIIFDYISSWRLFTKGRNFTKGRTPLQTRQVATSS